MKDQIEMTPEILKNFPQKGIVMVKFYADWCGPCKAMNPSVDEVLNEKKDLTVFKVNVDGMTDFTHASGVKGIPTLAFYKDGKLIKSVTGKKTKDEILKLIDSVENE